MNLSFSNVNSYNFNNMGRIGLDSVDTTENMDDTKSSNYICRVFSKAIWNQSFLVKPFVNFITSFNNDGVDIESKLKCKQLQLSY
jgi:hypothetical protein